MKIAIHQMCSGVNPQYNCDVMIQAISDSAKNGAIFYFAPEMSGLVDKNRTRAASNIVSEEQNMAIGRLCNAARQYGIWLHIGSLPIRLEGQNGKLANRSFVIDDKGCVIARYDKMHLFDVDLLTGESWRESSTYVGGGHPVVLDTPLGLMGLTICYDIRFPDLYSALAKIGTDIIAVPAAFTVPTGMAHWHILLRARAIEAEAYIIAAAQSGLHEDGRQTYGHSLVVDPWGDILLDMGEGEGLGFAEINLDRIAEVRRQIPVHNNLREIPVPQKQP